MTEAAVVMQYKRADGTTTSRLLPAPTPNPIDQVRGPAQLLAKYTDNAVDIIALSELPKPLRIDLAFRAYYNANGQRNSSTIWRCIFNPLRSNSRYYSEIIGQSGNATTYCWRRRVNPGLDISPLLLGLACSSRKGLVYSS